MRQRTFVLLPAVLLAALLAVSPAIASSLEGYDSQSRRYTYATLGSFPTLADGTELPIVWRVLAAGDSDAILMSDRILETKQLHHSYRPYPGWQESDLYAYLNGEFMARAFSPAEQSALLSGEDGGRVTLPSADDIRNAAYGFKDDNSRKLKATEYAMTTGLYEYEYKSYHPIWTRTPSTGHDFAQRTTKLHGKVGYLAVTAKDLGVIPCIRIELDRLSIEGGSGSSEDPYQLVPVE